MGIGGSSGATGVGGSSGATGIGGSSGATGIGGSSGATGIGGVGGTTGIPDCGTSALPDSGLSCNALHHYGYCTLSGFYSFPAPAATGGPISSGTYELDSIQAHWLRPDAGGGDLEVLRGETMVVAGSGTTLTAEVAQRWNTSTRRANYTLTISGTQLTFTQTCPVADGGVATRVVEYSAINGTLLLREQHTEGIVVSEYRQRSN
jgi:hypothetical protein